MANTFQTAKWTALADSLIGAKARPCTWIQRQGTYQESGPDVGKTLIAETPWDVLASPGLPIQISARGLETVVEADGDFWLAAGPLSFRPEIGDHVDMEGQRVSVVDLRPYPTSGEAAAFRVFFKGEAKTDGA